MAKVIFKDRTPMLMKQDEIDWRMELLHRAGYDATGELRVIAETLAKDEAVNVHCVTDMVANGCDLTLAAEIVATEPILPQ